MIGGGMALLILGAVLMTATLLLLTLRLYGRSLSPEQVLVRRRQLNRIMPPVILVSSGLMIAGILLVSAAALD